MAEPAAPTHVRVINRRSRGVRTPRRHISPKTYPITPDSMYAPLGSGLPVVMMCSYSALAAACRCARVVHSVMRVLSFGAGGSRRSEPHDPAAVDRDGLAVDPLARR